MRLLRLLPVSMVMGLLFFLSSQSKSTIPMPQFINVDKLAHAIAYSVLAFAALFAISDNLRRVKPHLSALLIVLFCLLHGLSDEFHQSFVPGRDVSGFDILADTAGAALAMLTWLATKKRQIAISD